MPSLCQLMLNCDMSTNSQTAIGNNRQSLRKIVWVDSSWGLKISFMSLFKTRFFIIVKVEHICLTHLRRKKYYKSKPWLFCFPKKYGAKDWYSIFFIFYWVPILSDACTWQTPTREEEYINQIEKRTKKELDLRVS